jgi:D-alanine transaminase
MPRVAYVNGEYISHATASVHIEDRGFQFADAVYEVISVIDGQLADFTGHMERLEYSLSCLNISMPVNPATFKVIMRELLRRNRLKNALIYIQISRGQAKRDFSFPVPAPSPTLVITSRSFDFDGNQNVSKGIKVITTEDIRWKRPDIKTVGLLGQVLAKQKAAESGCYEAWMIDDKGYITEGSSSNAWIVTRDRKIITRQANGSILKGVTRQALLNFVREQDYELVEQSFTPAQAYEATEAFTSSATALIMPVIEIDGHKIGDGVPGSVAKSLYSLYRSYVKDNQDSQYHWRA